MPSGAAQKLYVRDPIIREEERDSIQIFVVIHNSLLVLRNMNRVANIANHVQVPGGGKGGGAHGEGYQALSGLQERSSQAEVLSHLVTPFSLIISTSTPPGGLLQYIFTYLEAILLNLCSFS